MAGPSIKIYTDFKSHVSTKYEKQKIRVQARDCWQDNNYNEQKCVFEMFNIQLQAHVPIAIQYCPSENVIFTISGRLPLI